MEALDVLQNKSRDGSLHIINAIGVPRSLSTAFCRALNETDNPSIYINEPFNRENSTIAKAAQHILTACLDKSYDESTPLTVITKNMASYLSDEAFREISELAEGTLWNIRDPLSQMGSLMTRIVNDLFANPGEDKIEQDDIYPYLDDACVYLIDGPKSRDYSKTGWSSIDRHYENRDDSKLHYCIDGDYFSMNPTEILDDVCGLMDIPFSKKMIAGWSESFINVINIGNEAETKRSAWTSVASESTSIIPSVRPPIDLDKVPASLCEHIEKVALPAYHRLSRRS